MQGPRRLSAKLGGQQQRGSSSSSSSTVDQPLRFDSEGDSGAMSLPPASPGGSAAPAAAPAAAAAAAAATTTTTTTTSPRWSAEEVAAAWSRAGEKERAGAGTGTGAGAGGVKRTFSAGVGEEDPLVMIPPDVAERMLGLGVVDEPVVPRTPAPSLSLVGEAAAERSVAPASLPLPPPSSSSSTTTAPPPTTTTMFTLEDAIGDDALEDAAATAAEEVEIASAAALSRAASGEKQRRSPRTGTDMGIGSASDDAAHVRESSPRTWKTVERERQERERAEREEAPPSSAAPSSSILESEVAGNGGDGDTATTATFSVPGAPTPSEMDTPAPSASPPVAALPTDEPTTIPAAASTTSANGGDAASTTSTITTKGDLDKANRLLRKAKTHIDQLKVEVRETTERAAALEESLREAQAETDKVRSEFQKYRVRAEVARQQHEAEIARLQEQNIKYRHHNVVSNDTAVELDALRRRFMALERDKYALESMLSARMAEFEAEAAARHQAEALVRELEGRLDSPSALEFRVRELETDLATTRADFDDFRERAVEQMKRQEEEVRLLSSVDKNTELAYARDVVLKYLASTGDAKSQRPMEAAIATVFRFTPAEMEFIRVRRAAGGETMGGAPSSSSSSSASSGAADGIAAWLASWGGGGGAAAAAAAGAPLSGSAGASGAPSVGESGYQ